MRRRAKVVFQYGLAALLGLFVALTVIVRVETYRFRKMAEHLMADGQTLKLHQSSWPDAKSLIDTWGKYGIYEGSCDASFCRYEITLESPETRLESHLYETVKPDSQFVQFVWFLPFALMEKFAGTKATVWFNFVVQDGVVLRKGNGFTYVVPPSLLSPSGHSLIATSRADYPLGSLSGYDFDEQLAKHPNYVVSRPGGCSFCLMANVTYAPTTPDAEINRLSTYNLACISSLPGCRYLEDIFPAAEEWHLYDGTYGGRPKSGHPDVFNVDGVNPLTCDIPVVVRAREAASIVGVTALQEKEEKDSEGDIIQKGIMRLNDVLKGSAKFPVGSPFEVEAYDGFRSGPIEYPLAPGGQFLILGFGVGDRSQPLRLDHCQVIPDTAEARTEIQFGMAQNDHVRVRDPHSFDFIPH